MSDGRYLVWDTDIQKIRELNRQPPTRYLQTVAPYEANTGVGFGALAIDPSRGSLLTALIDTPSQTERIQQGGAVGYAIIVIGVIALAVGIVKLVTLSITSRKVKAQRKRDEPSSDNPLGRVLQAYEKNSDSSTPRPSSCGSTRRCSKRRTDWTDSCGSCAWSPWSRRSWACSAP